MIRSFEPRQLSNIFKYRNFFPNHFCSIYANNGITDNKKPNLVSLAYSEILPIVNHEMVILIDDHVKFANNVSGKISQMMPNAIIFDTFDVT